MNSIMFTWCLFLMFQAICIVNAVEKEITECGCPSNMTDEQRLCGHNINFLTHVKLLGDGSPKCHMPESVDVEDPRCMSVAYTFESTKVSNVPIVLSTPKFPDECGKCQDGSCELVPQEGVKYAISGNQFYKNVLACENKQAVNVLFINDRGYDIFDRNVEEAVELQKLIVSQMLDSDDVHVKFAAFSFDDTILARAQFGFETRTRDEVLALIDAFDRKTSFRRACVGDALQHAADNILVGDYDGSTIPNFCVVMNNGFDTGFPCQSRVFNDRAADLKQKCKVISISLGRIPILNVVSLIATNNDLAYLVREYNNDLAREVAQQCCPEDPNGDPKKVCNFQKCEGIFRETTHEEFHDLLEEYNHCPAAS